MTVLDLPLATRIVREAVRDKSYRAFPLGQEAGHFLRFKRKRLTASSYRDYESCLDKLARFYTDLGIGDLEPPVGTERLEELLDAHWGASAPRTYNKNLSILSEFSKWAVRHGKLHGDPTLLIERAKARGVYRTTFTTDQRAALLAANDDHRDRLALRLLMDYGLRKGALLAVQFRHFDHQRRRLTIFTKSESIRELPIPQAAFWLDLERLIQDSEARPDHYLLPRRKAIPYRGGTRMHLFPSKPMGEHGAHSWWYRCLEQAGIVEPGTTSGERMHKARHTAGQRVLDVTGNIKAVQKLLGHASLQTTADTYLDWDLEQLAGTMREVVDE